MTPVGDSITEEKIEYRDENGRLLEEEEVKALEGKVSFSTRYETRTRLVDEAGNKLYEAVVGVNEGNDAGVAGTLAVGENPETGGAADASAVPPQVNVGADLKKEAGINQGAKGGAEPSEQAELGSATGKEEL